LVYIIKRIHNTDEIMFGTAHELIISNEIIFEMKASFTKKIIYQDV